MKTFFDEKMGEDVGVIPVQAGAEFLHLFSEQLYTSPQKAFEELVANSWDAGATCVDIITPRSSDSDDVPLMVIDNGESMDGQGLKDLWRVAVSPKKGKCGSCGRPFIGKFGIGKLATYVLADKLTYVCQDKQGKIRYVSMDYGQFRTGENESKFVQDIKLSMRQISKEDLFSNLGNMPGGNLAIDFIQAKHSDADTDFYDEYNCPQENFTPSPKRETWTLVILSALKEKGQKLQVGRLRNMLRSAMPLGNSITIRMLNNDTGSMEPLTSTKSDSALIKEWILGSDETIEDFKDFDVEWEEGNKQTFRIIPDKESKSVSIEGMENIGKITGRFTLYKESISGGKSEKRAISNGFFINILGRVVNQEDSYLGTENMHHATWARFRCTVRADAMNEYLAVSREKLQTSNELTVFRAFLDRLFKIARACYDSDSNSEVLDINQKWEERVGFIATQPLQHFVSNRESDSKMLRNRLLQGDDNFKKSETGNMIEKIKIASFSVSSNETVKYDLKSSSIIINKDHPYVQEFGTGKDAKEIIETILTATYLSDIYSMDIGISPELIEQVMQYREGILNAKAMAKRKNGKYIARLMMQYEKDSSKNGAKAFEEVVASAFRCLGFRVESKGKKGEEDAYAQAGMLPYKEKNGQVRDYSFIIEAKTTSNTAVATSNLNLEATLKHKCNSGADYAVIVATGYQTVGDDTGLMHSLMSKPYSSFLCLTTKQVIALLGITAQHGALSLDKFKEIFDCKIGNKVDQWIEKIKEQRQKESDKFSWKDFIECLRRWENKHESVLHFGAISALSHQSSPDREVNVDMVRSIARGVETMVPEYLMVINEDSFRINANVETIATAIIARINQIVTEEKE